MSEVKLLPCPCGNAAQISMPDASGKRVAHCESEDCFWAITGFSDEQVAARWNAHANLAELQREVEGLRAEVEEARGLVIEANNSLYGSQGYFHSLNGGAYDRHHLSRGIEDLKTSSRARYAAESRAERLAGALRGVLPFVATQAIGCHGDKCREEWFYSCSGEEEAGDVAQRGREAFRAATAALEQENDDA